MAINIFDFNSVMFGARMWIWWYLFLSVFLFSFVLVYFFKEKLKKKYFEMRYPEKLIKIIMHYKSGYFKEYWRIIPEKNDEFMIEGKVYKFSDKKVLRDNDFFLRKKNNELYAILDGKKYNINDSNKIIYRWRSYPELHYFYNIPVPIDFDCSSKALEFSSEQMQEFKDNDLFAKLLTMDTQKSLLIFLFVIGVINLLLSAFIIAKEMGWLDHVAK